MTQDIEFIGLDVYLMPYQGFFHRSESRELAECYLAGLIMDGERKSVEPMSKRVNASERGMQRLLTTAKWNEDQVSAEYRRSMLSVSADPQGLLVLDDTGFPKKGHDSVCVARQYCGASGKTDNCQIGVSLTYVGADVSWPYVMELFVPASWDEQTEECQAKRNKTYMPESAHYRPKWQIALALVDRARADRVPHRAVLADSWYGNIPEFRQGLELREESYMLGVHANTQVFLEEPVFDRAAPVPERKRGRPRKAPIVTLTTAEPVKLSSLGASITEETWQRLVLRENSRERPLVAEAVSLRVWPARGWKQGNRHEQVWLMIERRPLSRGGFELRYFFSNMPLHLATLDLARLYHDRYWIEHGYQQLKEELGLDHHEGRSWVGWHRHVLLTFLAYGYLTLTRLQQKKLQNSCRGAGSF